MDKMEALVGGCSDPASDDSDVVYCCHGDKTAMTDKMFSRDGCYRDIEEALKEIIGSRLDRKSRSGGGR